MQNNVSSRRLSSLIIVFILGGSILLGGLTTVEQDTWLSLILSWVIFLPLLIIYIRVVKLHPGMNIYDIMVTLFGKQVGKLLTLAMTLYFLYLCALVLRNFGDFIFIVSLSETPHVVIMISMVVLTAYMAKSGFDILMKWTIITLPVYIFLIAFPVVISFEKLEFSNLLPFLNHPFKEIIRSAFEYFSFPFAEIIVLLGMSDSFKSIKKPCKVYICSTFICLVFLLAINIRNILLLGLPMGKSLFFPSYVAIRLVDMADFMSRIEGSVSTNFVLAGTAKIAVCLLAASKGMASLFGIGDYKRLVMPVAMLALALATIAHDSTMEMFAFLAYYPFFAFPFQVLIPLLVWIAGEIRHHRNKNKSTPAQA
ncbi:MAG: endospore germination permease [Clostridiales bacterium]|nr:endospore germination permease [Clostridiales bacterium]